MRPLARGDEIVEDILLVKFSFRRRCIPRHLAAARSGPARAHLQPGGNRGRERRRDGNNEATEP